MLRYGKILPFFYFVYLPYVYVYEYLSRYRYLPNLPYL